MHKRHLILLSVILICCSDEQLSSVEKNSPPGYDLSKPQRFQMPESLVEISGICFRDNKADTIFAEQDEEGKLYYLRLGDKRAGHVKFGKKGDYEDLTIINNVVIMLRSDGTLFSFPLPADLQSDATGVREWSGLLPEGEYEGMYGDEADNRIYVLCKHCGDEKASKAVTVFVFQLHPDGSISARDHHDIDVKAIDKITGKKKIKFNPSAIGRNPLTRQWYILSSVKKMLVLADSNWKVNEVYPLDPAVFRQPEGIAFDDQNNLYISNEGDKLSLGNVLKFVYRPLPKN